ncbi:LysR family transcriptional regulator [Streptomyces paludis]|uniref:LysR family transcriptional regulator n=1 Tax=Streptomyces paludis TaxID=2282738 RepID=A0A345HLW6_9ACTN|nr:LysR family transcriptional regulator [Streptomyces paludis]AXG77690.1 LysR family transcriptional regulator [Streptomyces paludis]
MSDLHVRQLRYFVTVAEELHFGRAARRLDMAQPPLSRAIRDLERQLGVTLLERTTRQVRLTAAGEVLLRDARTVLDTVAAAVRRAQHAGRPDPGLRLAMKADYDGGLLPRILAAYRHETAALPVELMLVGKGEQLPALRGGRADIALLPVPFDTLGLDAEPLLTEPRLVALATTDPLAARPGLRLADLAGRTLPDGKPADREGHPLTGVGGAGDPQQRKPADDAGPPLAAARPRIMDLAQIFSLIELGSVIWFPPASVARRHPRPGIVYRPVDDLPPLTLALAWPRESRSPAIAAFVRTATTVAEAAYPEAAYPTGPANLTAGDGAA